MAKNKQHPPQERLQHPEEWTTGDEPMTEAQRAYVEALAERTGEQLQGDLTKAEASQKIEKLKEKTGQGQ
jgi:hypothetical protein